MECFAFLKFSTILRSGGFMKDHHGREIRSPARHKNNRRRGRKGFFGQPTATSGLSAEFTKNMNEAIRLAKALGEDFVMLPSGRIVPRTKAHPTPLFTHPIPTPKPVQHSWFAHLLTFFLKLFPSFRRS
jgi:hypothetical protein